MTKFTQAHIEAECNQCEWQGTFEEMIKPADSDDVHKCPQCGTDDIYYFKQPPPLTLNP